MEVGARAGPAMRVVHSEEIVMLRGRADGAGGMWAGMTGGGGGGGGSHWRGPRHVWAGAYEALGGALEEVSGVRLLWVLGRPGCCQRER